MSEVEIKIEPEEKPVQGPENPAPIVVENHVTMMPETAPQNNPLEGRMIALEKHVQELIQRLQEQEKPEAEPEEEPVIILEPEPIPAEQPSSPLLLRILGIRG